MEYTKNFASLEDLGAFVQFHLEETGLLFFFDKELKTAWIEADERVCGELKRADQ